MRRRRAGFWTKPWRWAHQDQMSSGLLTLVARAQGDRASLGRMVVDDWAQEIAPPVPPGFADMASFNAALGEELVTLHTRKAAPIDQSLNRGTQTPGSNLFARKTRLLCLLEDSLTRPLRAISPSYRKTPLTPFWDAKKTASTFRGHGPAASVRAAITPTTFIPKAGSVPPIMSICRPMSPQAWATRARSNSGNRPLAWAHTTSHRAS